MTEAQATAKRKWWQHWHRKAIPLNWAATRCCLPTRACWMPFAHWQPFVWLFFHPPPNKYDQKPLWHHIKRSHLAIFWQHNTTELSPAEATARECWENCSQKKRPPSKTEIVYCGSIALKRLHRSVPMFETHKPLRTKIYAFHPRGNSGEIMGKGFQTFFKKE